MVKLRRKMLILTLKECLICNIKPNFSKRGKYINNSKKYRTHKLWFLDKQIKWIDRNYLTMSRMCFSHVELISLKNSMTALYHHLISIIIAKLQANISNNFYRRIIKKLKRGIKGDWEPYLQLCSNRNHNHLSLMKLLPFNH